MTAEHLANLHVLAVLAIDAAEDAGLRRADLDVDLVGLELDQRLAGGNRIALLAQPLRKEGDVVAAGEPLVELETDKIDLEVSAPQAGVLSRITARTART